jgi:hypothetical protein
LSQVVKSLWIRGELWCGKTWRKHCSKC